MTSRRDPSEKEAFAATIAAQSQEAVTLRNAPRDEALAATVAAVSQEPVTIQMPRRDQEPDAVTLPMERRGSASDSLPTTARIGRYAVLRKLGEGGMGVVVIGYDESLDRKAAVKVLHPGAAAEQWLVREAQALAKLSHPNVVPVYEVGRHEDRVFLAMEYVEGRTLTDYLAEGGRPLEEILRVFVQAGRGLAAAHAAGLVHRDFKPDNVLVGKDGRARVVDFGIASLADRGGATPIDLEHANVPMSASPTALSSPLTVAGTLMGTPLFMSPEQFHGQRAGAASDQFSFCVALFEAVHGQAPYTGETIFELAANVCSGKRRPPPAKSTAPVWLRDLLDRGLAVKPDDRHPSLASLLDAIETNLPDAKEDAAHLRREQVILFGILFLYAAGVTAYTAWRGTAAYDQWSPLTHGVVFAFVSFVGVALVWKGLRRNAFGRRFARLVPGVSMIVLAHRLIQMKLGTPVFHIAVIDCFILTLAFLLATLVIDRRFQFIVALGFALAVAAAFVPTRAPIFFGLLGLVGLGTGVVLWGRQRA